MQLVTADSGCPCRHGLCPGQTHERRPARPTSAWPSPGSTARGRETTWGRWTVARPVTCARRRSQPTRRGSSPAFAPPPTGLTLARRFPRAISLEKDKTRKKKFTARDMRADVRPKSGVGRAPWSTATAVTRCPSPVAGRSRVLPILAADAKSNGGSAEPRRARAVVPNAATAPCRDEHPRHALGYRKCSERSTSRTVAEILPMSTL